METFASVKSHDLQKQSCQKFKVQGHNSSLHTFDILSVGRKNTVQNTNIKYFSIHEHISIKPIKNTLLRILTK